MATTAITLRLEPDELAAIDRQAKREGVSRTALLRRAARGYLGNYPDLIDAWSSRFEDTGRRQFWEAAEVSELLRSARRAFTAIALDLLEHHGRGVELRVADGEVALHGARDAWTRPPDEIKGWERLRARWVSEQIDGTEYRSLDLIIGDFTDEVGLVPATRVGTVTGPFTTLPPAGVTPRGLIEGVRLVDAAGQRIPATSEVAAAS